MVTSSILLQCSNTDMAVEALVKEFVQGRSATITTSVAKQSCEHAFRF